MTTPSRCKVINVVIRLKTQLVQRGIQEEAARAGSRREEERRGGSRGRGSRIDDTDRYIHVDGLKLDVGRLVFRL